MGHNARATRAAVDAGEGHGSGLGARLRLEAEVDTVLCDGARTVGRGLPGQVSAL